MANDPEGLVGFDAGGARYVAVFGFRAMKAVEAHYDLPFFMALQQAMPALNPEDAADPAKVAAAGASVRMTDIGHLFRFSLLKHHPDLTEAEVEDLIDEIGLDHAGVILGDAVASAVALEGGGDASANPRKRRRAAKTG